MRAGYLDTTLRRLQASVGHPGALEEPSACGCAVPCAATIRYTVEIVRADTAELVLRCAGLQRESMRALRQLFTPVEGYISIVQAYESASESEGAAQQ